MAMKGFDFSRIEEILENQIDILDRAAQRLHISMLEYPLSTREYSIAVENYGRTVNAVVPAIRELSRVLQEAYLTEMHLEQMEGYSENQSYKEPPMSFFAQLLNLKPKSAGRR